MSGWASAPLTILWVIMLSDMVGASLAAWKCLRKRKGAETVSIAIAALLIAGALESLNQIVNGVTHAGEFQPPQSYTIQWIAGRALKAIGTWWAALVLLND